MRHKIIFILILVLGIILRVWHWVYSSTPITTDVSYWGLMAEDIACKQNFPVWRYGSVTIGSIFSYLTSLLWPILGRNSICGIELIFSILSILAAYFVGKEFFGKNGGLLSALIISLAPGEIIRSSVLPAGVYNILIFSGTLLFYIAIKGKGDRLFFFGALLAGILFWTHFLSICFLLPCLAYIILNKKIKIKRWIIFIILFFIGSSPFWIFNFRNSFLSFQNISLKPIENILWNDMFEIKDIFSTSACLLLVYFMCFIYVCNRLDRDIFKSKESLILFFFAFGIAIVSRVRINPGLDLNPFIILYAGIPYIVTFTKKRSKSILVAIIILQMGNCWITAGNEKIKNDKQNCELNELLLNIKTRCLYTNIGLAPIINYLSNGKIMTGYYEKCNFLPYTDIVDTARCYGAVLPIEESLGFSDNLKYVCKDYKKADIKGHTLFSVFIKPVMKVRNIETLKWEASANYNNEEAGFAFDRDFSTYWTTHVRKIPNMYFNLDLGREVIVNKVLVYLGDLIQNRAIGIKIEVSCDNENWNEVVNLENNTNILFWSGHHLYWKNYADRQEYYFEPSKARYIRLNQLGFNEEDFNYWAIKELFVYGPIQEGSELKYNFAELKTFLRNEDMNNCYADYWISINLNKEEIISKKINMGDNPLIITDRNTDIENDFAFYNISYKKITIGDFYIYHLAGRKLFQSDKNKWTGSSNAQMNGIKNAFDNNMETRWSTEKNQTPGYFLQIDLPKAASISGIRLWHKGSQYDWPRGVRIECLLDNAGWGIVKHKIDYSDMLYWTGFSIITDTSEYYTYAFEPIKTKAIRIVLDKGDAVFYWSVHEIDLVNKR